MLPSNGLKFALLQLINKKKYLLLSCMHESLKVQSSLFSSFTGAFFLELLGVHTYKVILHPLY